MANNKDIPYLTSPDKSFIASSLSDQEIAAQKIAKAYRQHERKTFDDVAFDSMQKATPELSVMESDKTRADLLGYKADKSRSNAHAALAMAGMAPGPTGFAADITDAVLYAKEKRWKDMGWSLIGAIPILGQIAGGKKIAKLTKSIKMTAGLKRIAKYERMGESIDNGSLLFANKKWQKMIDEGLISIDKKGDMWARAGGTKGLMAKTGNVYEVSRGERYADYYELMGDISKDMDKVWKGLTPAEKAMSKSLGKSPILRKQLKDMVLKLDKLLPKGN
jgi:hypothetical protein